MFSDIGIHNIYRIISQVCQYVQLTDLGHNFWGSTAATTDLLCVFHPFSVVTLLTYNIRVGLSYIKSCISGVISYHLILLVWQITPIIRDGINRISLSGGDSRTFCFGVRLVKRRTLAQVLITDIA